MRKYLFLCSALILTGCIQQNLSNIDVLPPEEVLKNAAEVSALLESAGYEMDLTFDTQGGLGGRLQGTAVIDGTLHNTGEHLQFTVDANATFTDTEGDTRIRTNADVVVIGPEELYLRLNAFTSTGQRTLVSPLLVGMLQGTWLMLGTGAPESPTSVSADPRLLHAQAQVVQVTQELPLAKLEGDVTYHYKVRIDPEKLVAYLAEVSKERGLEFDEAQALAQYSELEAAGELWIDAQTYEVRKLRWVLQPLTTDTGSSVSGTIDVRYFDFNEAEPIVAPENAQSPQQALFSDVFSEGVSEQMQLNTQENIVRSLLE